VRSRLSDPTDQTRNPRREFARWQGRARTPSPGRQYQQASHPLRAARRKITGLNVITYDAVVSAWVKGQQLGRPSASPYLMPSHPLLA